MAAGQPSWLATEPGLQAGSSTFHPSELGRLPDHSCSGHIGGHIERGTERRIERRTSRARALPGTWPHGKPRSCTELHEADDVLVGQPLCAGCYNYDGHALWHAHAPGPVAPLHHLPAIYLRRELAYAAGMTVKACNASPCVWLPGRHQADHRG